LPKFNDLRRSHPGEAWKCPEVKVKARAQSKVTASEEEA
jgi:hypothetical protein